MANRKFAAPRGVAHDRRAPCAVAGLLLCFAIHASAAQAWIDGPANDPQQQLSWETFRAFGSTSGLPQNTVFAMAQTADGYVYVGTQDGLSRYDGQHFAVIALGASEHHAFVQRLEATAAGGLWIGTDTLGLWRLDNGEAIAVLDPEGKMLPSIEALAARANGEIWAGTPEGLYRCDPQRCTPVAGTGELAIAALCEGTREGAHHLWIGGAEDGLHRLDDLDASTPRLSDWRLGKVDGLPNDSVRAMVQWGGTDGSDLWIGTGRGVARWSGAQLTQYISTDRGPMGGVLALLPSHDRSGAAVLRAAISRGGVATFRDDGTWSLVGLQQGLLDDYVFSLLETSRDQAQPTLWVGTASGGLLRREPGRWHAFDERVGLPNRVVVGLGEVRFPDGYRGMWLGTVAGAVRWRDGRWEPWLPPALRERVVYDAIDEGDDLWLATDRGLVKLNRQGYTEFTSDNSELPGVLVADLLTRRNDAGAFELWASTHHGLAVWSGARLQHHDIPGLPELDNFVRAMVNDIDADGHQTMWAATQQGLFWYDNDRWRELAVPCLPDRSIYDLKLAHGALWAAGRSGVARIDLDAAHACATLPTGPVPRKLTYRIEFDRNGRLYAFGYDGVARVTPPSAGEARLQDWTIETFGLLDGLPDLEFNRASFVDSEGRIWAGSVGGAAVFDPHDEPLAGASKPLRLHGAVGDGAQADALVDGMQLAPDGRPLRFDYALLGYQREHRYRFRTQLEGLESEPSAWSAATSVAFTRVPPGSYRFRVWGRDDNGVLSGPAELGFNIATPIWQRPWAVVLYALALVAAGLIIGRWRAHTLAARAVALENEIAARTSELADANRRLEQVSLTDPLTGLYNRRYFALEIVAETERARRRTADQEVHADLLVFLIDVDHFKAINDRYGHAAGDAVLVELARRLREFARASDLTVRWGGEEFLMLLRDSDRGAEGALAERLLAAIRDVRFEAGTERIAVTASIGWAAFPFALGLGPALTIEQVVRLADKALYAAKAAGRDRAIGAQFDPSGETVADLPGVRINWRH